MLATILISLLLGSVLGSILGFIAVRKALTLLEEVHTAILQGDWHEDY